MIKEKEIFLTKVKGNELLDLLENTGILQEVNRTFFHPLGLNLKLEKNLTIELERTNEKHGCIFDTINKFSIKSFMRFAQEKHKKRQELAGFIIQTRDMLRNERLEVPVTPVSSLKLQTLLKELDNFTFQIKRRLMERSKDLDNMLFDFSKEDLNYYMFEDLQKGNRIDAAARAMIIERIGPINVRMAELRKIKKDQDKTYKRR
jgi:hypothetical protein